MAQATIATTRTSSWLASYVLGLASAGRPASGCLDEIIEEAGAEVTQLRAARRELRRLSIVDNTLRARAHALLSLAIVLATDGAHPAS